MSDFMEWAPKPDQSTERVDAWEALLAARRELLDEAGGYFTSEEIARALGCRSDSFSLRIADARKRDEVLGVAYLGRWCHPRFQFRVNSDFQPYPEMRPILQALTPDHRGWDRLHWFLTRHPLLEGRTPLEVWQKDRQKVVEAARREGWDGRD